MITRKQRLSYQNYPIQFDTDGYRKNVYYSLGLGSVKVDQESQVASMMAPGGTVATPQSSDVNGPPSGVIGGEDATPAETVADDIPMDVPEGSFIVNAAAAEVAGYKDIKKMIMDAVGVAKRLGVDISTGNDKIGDEEAVDLLVSKGEVYIEPTLAKIIGYDVLEKINNRGKREVARRQEEAEQQQQAPMQEGGFVKKKFADGGQPDPREVNPDYQYYDDIDAFIPSKYELLKEVNPTSEQDIQMGDIEFQMDMLRRSGDDPVMREAFEDAQSRLPSEYIDMRNMSIGELYRETARDRAREMYFKNAKITPEALDVGLDYLTKDEIEPRQKQGLDDSTSPDTEYEGSFDPADRTIVSQAHTKDSDPVDVSATLFHELTHKSHEKLMGVGPAIMRGEDGQLIENPRYSRQFQDLLHLDVHRRTYEAYKDELSPKILKRFISRAYHFYGTTGLTRDSRKKIRDTIIKAGVPLSSETRFFDFRNLSRSELKRIADTTFDAIAKLPEIKAVDRNLKAAADQAQKLRFRDSSGFAEGGQPSLEEQQILSILNENSDKNFVQRILQPAQAPAPIKSGDMQHTHIMRAEFLDREGKQAAVFPEVIEKDGKLVRLTLSQAVEHARRTGEYIPFSSIQDADEFSRNYKTRDFKQYYESQRDSSGFIPKN